MVSKGKRTAADTARLFADFSVQRSNLSECSNRQNIGRYLYEFSLSQCGNPAEARISIATSKIPMGSAGKCIKTG
jgi:hypothetical protein